MFFRANHRCQISNSDSVISWGADSGLVRWYCKYGISYRDLAEMMLKRGLAVLSMTDKTSPYGAAITQLKAEEKCPPDTVQRQVKYLSNIIEAGHGKLKRLINLVRTFKSMKQPTPPSKISGSCACLKKEQLYTWKYGPGFTGEIRLIERQSVSAA